ncbi:MAG: ribonuclease P protein subunit [Desulfurococcales archaeon]|nr:ribonuclease P protein subunit [Desulfurococcales archaeon]MCE4605394.1 ribonuclease P protein subunit [Desulfurococcales archaeon]
MRITRRNLANHPLIGLKAKILSYPDPTIRGVEGVIVGDNRRTLVIDTGRREVLILKVHVVLLIEIPGGKWVRVKGELLTGTPPDRAKRILRGR